MPLGRSREEQELTELLSKTLVAKEVIEPMEKLGWTHGTPPPPDYSGPPAPAEGAPGKEAAPAAAADGGQPAPKPASAPAPTDVPKADTLNATELDKLFEPLRDANGLILGKYKTGLEAFKGAGHLANMAKQAFTERDAAVAKLTENSVRTPAAAPPAAAPQPVTVSAPSRERVTKAQADYDAVLSKITENGGVLDAETSKELSRAQFALSEATADLRYEERQAAAKQQTDVEKSEWDKVDAFMAENHPASTRFAEETALHIQSDPLLAKAVNALLAQGDRLGATLLAWQSFEKAHGEQVSAEEKAKAESKEADLAAREQVRQEQLEKARKDAGVIQGSAGGAGVHQNPHAATSQEEIVAARERMIREGDAPGTPAAKRFRDLVIGPSLDPTFFPR